LSGGNILSANSINLKPSGDTDDYLSFSTVGNIPRTTIIGGQIWQIIGHVPSVGTAIQLMGDSEVGLNLFWDDFSNGALLASNATMSLTTDNNGNLTLAPGGIGVIDVTAETIDLGTNTIADGQMNGDWSLNFGDLTEPDNVDGRIDPDAILEKSEDSYWRFNGTLVPEAGGGGSPPTLTLSDGTTVYCDRGTAKGHVFDNDVYYTATGYKPQTGTGARTVSLWHKPVGSGNRNIWHYGGSGAGNQFWAGRIRDTVASNAFTVLFNVGSANSVIDLKTDGLWHHIAATFPASGTIGDTKIYIDEVIDPGMTFTNPSTAVNTLTTLDLKIGTDFDATASVRTEGCLSDMAFFDTELTATQVLNIYNRQKSTIIEGTSLPHPGDMAGPILTLGMGTFGSLNVNGEFGFNVETSGNLTLGQSKFTVNAVTGDTLIGGELKSVEGRVVNTTRITGTTTLNATHHHVFCDTDGGAFPVNLPAGVDGQTYRIINAGSNDVTVVPDGAELLDGENASKSFSRGVLILTYETTEGWM
ncbi:hypothetical protein LCGC14_1021800, partial [marine sediment metagenome]